MILVLDQTLQVVVSVTVHMVHHLLNAPTHVKVQNLLQNVTTHVKVQNLLQNVRIRVRVSHLHLSVLTITVTTVVTVMSSQTIRYLVTIIQQVMV
jgi:hypothetical protein